MYDISMRTPNAQKYIRYDWAAWEEGSKGNNEEFRRILNERSKFRKENFTLEDYDSMIEECSDYPPSRNRWQQMKEEYLAEHQQKKIKKVKKVSTKTLTKCLRKTA